MWLLNQRITLATVLGLRGQPRGLCSTSVQAVAAFMHWCRGCRARALCRSCVGTVWLGRTSCGNFLESFYIVCFVCLSIQINFLGWFSNHAFKSVYLNKIIWYR